MANKRAETMRLPTGEEIEVGPALRALRSDRQRQFVLQLFALGRGGNATAAARAAGFGNAEGTTRREALAVIGCRLLGDPKIQRALVEVGRQRLASIGPAAMTALERLVATPDHRDHGRAVALALSYTWPVETLHRMEVQHQHDIAPGNLEQVMRRIGELAQAAGLDVKKLPPVIDLQPVPEPQMS